MTEITGTVLSIERGTLHDGPGLRTTVFLKGCPLLCLWCHNPESQLFEPELYVLGEKCIYCGACKAACSNHNFDGTKHMINREACNACGKCVNTCPAAALEIKGTVMTAKEVIDIALKDKIYYEYSSGGLTLSGGEPLAQFEFTLELLRLAKESGLHTCIETSGYADTGLCMSILPYVDLFLFDYKESDDSRYIDFTGAPQALILENLTAIDKAGGKIILRCPIIPGCNEREEHFSAIAAMANSLHNIVEINIMPYHPMGISKAARIGRKPPNLDTKFPSDERINSWVNAVSRETEVFVKRG